jgi:hypothetical protein
MDPATRKRALDAVLDARNALRLQIQTCNAYDEERGPMLETLERITKAAVFGMADDGTGAVFPTLYDQGTRRK